MESELSQSVRDLSLLFCGNKDTIFTHITQIGKVRRFGKMVPYELDENLEQQHFESCITLFSRHNNVLF